MSAALVAGACAGGDDDGEARDGRGGRYQPTFTPLPCEAPVPQNARIECGTLVVPEDRAKPEGRQVRLPVAIVHPAGPVTAADPLVQLAGGPGDVGLVAAERYLERDIGPRNAIVFDQRGAGTSEPDLDCPEVEEAQWGFVATTDDRATEEARVLDAWRTCRTRLARAADLDSYDTQASAADVADLRTALGFDRWNLRGVSYGTTLALEVMRSHPEGLRAVVLDASLPPTVGVGGMVDADLATGAFQRLFDTCTRAPPCAARYPAFEEDYRQVLRDLDANPHRATVTEEGTGKRREVAFTGADIASGLFDALYESGLIPSIPSIVEQLRRGDRAILDQVATSAFDVSGSKGMYASVDCADRGRFDTAKGVDAALRDHPEYATILTADLSSVCPVWDVEPASAAFNEPVRSDLPTLVLVGALDPITPPDLSRATAATLSRSTFVEVPGLGHGVTFWNDCTQGLFRAFLNDPTAPPDTSCVAQMGPPNFS